MKNHHVRFKAERTKCLQGKGTVSSSDLSVTSNIEESGIDQHNAKLKNSNIKAVWPVSIWLIYLMIVRNSGT